MKKYLLGPNAANFLANQMRNQGASTEEPVLHRGRVSGSIIPFKITGDWEQRNGESVYSCVAREVFFDGTNYVTDQESLDFFLYSPIHLDDKPDNEVGDVVFAVLRGNNWEIIGGGGGISNWGASDGFLISPVATGFPGIVLTGGQYTQEYAKIHLPATFPYVLLERGTAVQYMPYLSTQGSYGAVGDAGPVAGDQVISNFAVTSEFTPDYSMWEDYNLDYANFNWSATLGANYNGLVGQSLKDASSTRSYSGDYPTRICAWYDGRQSYPDRFSLPRWVDTTPVSKSDWITVDPMPGVLTEDAAVKIALPTAMPEFADAKKWYSFQWGYGTNWASREYTGPIPVKDIIERGNGQINVRAIYRGQSASSTYYEGYSIQ